MSLIAERAVVGALILDSASLVKVCKFLQPTMFRNEILSRIYKEYLIGFEQNYPVDAAVLQQKTSDIDFNLLSEEIIKCASDTITSAGIEAHAQIIVNDYKQAMATHIMTKTKLEADDIDTQIAVLINKLESLKSDTGYDTLSMPEIVNEYQGKYFCNKENQKPIKLGFETLDKIFTLEKQDLTIIAARPAVGKSAFVTQITAQLAKQGKKIAFYSLEMSKQQIYERMLATLSGVSLSRIRSATSFRSDRERESVELANANLSKYDRLFISDGSCKTVSQIKAECKHMDYDLIVIDYLQLLSSESTYKGNRTAEVGEISRALKNMAKELDAPVICLSQLNRVSTLNANKKPTMSELRESGSIEQDANNIILLWNDDEKDYNSKGLELAKQRQGQTGEVKLYFDGKLMKFEEISSTIKVEEEIEEKQEQNWHQGRINEVPF